MITSYLNIVLNSKPVLHNNTEYLADLVRFGLRTFALKIQPFFNVHSAKDVVTATNALILR